MRSAVKRFSKDTLELVCRPEELIGMGGMARVIKGVLKGAQNFERSVAVKELLPPFEDVPSYKKYLISEGRILSRINHPNVVQVLGLTEQDGLVRVVLEYIDGINLRDLIETADSLRMKISLGEISALISDILKGLTGISLQLRKEKERAAFIHRDLCPENLVVDFQGNCKIVDFGIAKLGTLHGEESGLKPSGLKGRYQYMSPEQRSGDSMDSRSDIYSVGVIHQELLERLGDPTDQSLNNIRNLVLSRAVTNREGRFCSFEEYLSLVEELAPSAFSDRKTLSNRLYSLRECARPKANQPTPILKKNKRNFLWVGSVANVAAILLLCICSNLASSEVSRSSFHMTTWPPAIVRLNGFGLAETESIEVSPLEHELEIIPVRGKAPVRIPIRIKEGQENHFFLFFQ